jgi:hypothetical protein
MKGLDSISVALLALDITWSLLSLSLSLVQTCILYQISYSIAVLKKKTVAFCQNYSQKALFCQAFGPVRIHRFFGVFWNADVYAGFSGLRILVYFGMQMCIQSPLNLYVIHLVDVQYVYYFIGNLGSWNC